MNHSGVSVLRGVIGHTASEALCKDREIRFQNLFYLRLQKHSNYLPKKFAGKIGYVAAKSKGNMQKICIKIESERQVRAYGVRLITDVM
jgi:hypothetical protein